MIFIRLDVTVDTASLEQAGSRLPRAISDGLTDTLKVAQGKQRARMQERFTIRRPAFLNQSVKITLFPRRDRLTGELAIAAPNSAPPDRANVFGKFERGGLKRPRDGGFLAVPIVGSPAKRTKRSPVRDAWRPSSLLENGVPGGGRAYIETRNGVRVLLGEVKATNAPIGPKLPRKRKGQPAPVLRQVRPLYLFIKSAPIPRTLAFVPGVTRDIQREWRPAFTKRWNEQIARASARARA